MLKIARKSSFSSSSSSFSRNEIIPIIVSYPFLNHFALTKHLKFEEITKYSAEELKI